MSHAMDAGASTAAVANVRCDDQTADDLGEASSGVTSGIAPAIEEQRCCRAASIGRSAPKRNVPVKFFLGAARQGHPTTPVEFGLSDVQHP